MQVKVDPPGGTQQITVQHVPDEWKGIANTYTLGGVQQVSIISEAPPHPPAILRAATTSILRALPRSLFSPGTFDPRPFLHPGTAVILRALTSPLFGALTTRFSGAAPSCGSHRPCLANTGWGFFLLIEGGKFFQKVAPR